MARLYWVVTMSRPVPPWGGGGQRSEVGGQFKIRNSNPRNPKETRISKLGYFVYRRLAIPRTNHQRSEVGGQVGESVNPKSEGRNPRDQQPSSKDQDPMKSQIANLQTTVCKLIFVFAAWSFTGAWRLELGASFRVSPQAFLRVFALWRLCFHLLDQP